MRNNMKKPLYTIISVLAVSALSSCWWEAGDNDPGIEYAPDMYYSKGYEPMTQYSDSSKYRYNPYYMTMREPVRGTVAIGQLEYQYPLENTAEGYAASAANHYMGTLSVADQQEGVRLFGIYCSPCHGMEGNGDGPVASKQAALKPSWGSYNSKTVSGLSTGTIYHVITYGKNNMGSYAYALTPKERWCVAAYVKRMMLKDSLGNMPAMTEVTDNTPVQFPDSSRYKYHPHSTPVMNMGAAEATSEVKPENKNNLSGK